MAGIPGNLAPVFVAAGKQYNIPPKVLAGVAQVESAMGSNRGPSSAGAVGLMQFEPSTAKGIGINPYNDRQAIFGAAKLLTQYGYHQDPLRALGAYNGGPGNPQYSYAHQVMSQAQQLAPQLGGVSAGTASSGGIPQAPTSASVSLEVPKQVNQFDAQGFQQAQRRYQLGQYLQGQKNPFDIGPKIPGLSAPNPLFSSGLLPTTAPNQADYTIAQTVLQKVAGSTPLTTHPAVPTHASFKGYVNPIPGATVGRTDMGVDANLPVGAPIRAIGDSKVVGISPNWYKGQPYVLLQLLSGPHAGKFYYVSEQISPSVRPGQTVRAGQPIGTYAQSGTGIEIGWGSPTPGRTLAQATSGYSEGQVTPAGANFRSFLAHL